MRNIIYFLSLIFAGLLFQTACNKDDNPNPNEINPPDDKPYVDLAKMPYTNLSDYQFFTSTTANFVPNQGVIYYDLNTGLFANYAQKLRYLYLPPNTTATYKNDGVFDFPEGTVIIKHFYYKTDLRNPNSPNYNIETRLLVKFATEWQTFSYLWNEEGTDAVFSVIGKQIPVSWIDDNGITQNINYIIPNKNECKGCHSADNLIVPLGPNARNLNKMIDNNGTELNQLAYLVSTQKLSNAPTDLSQVPSIPNFMDTTADLNQRARGYLDVNCAGCHNPKAAANNSGLDLSYTQTNPVEYGVCKSPVAAGAGSGTFNYDIVPAHPERSIMPYRMASLAVDVAMPELLRTTIDTAGVTLVRQWIAAMPPGPCQ